MDTQMYKIFNDIRFLAQSKMLGISKDTNALLDIVDDLMIAMNDIGETPDDVAVWQSVAVAADKLNKAMANARIWNHNRTADHIRIRKQLKTMRECAAYNEKCQAEWIKRNLEDIRPNLKELCMDLLMQTERTHDKPEPERLMVVIEIDRVEKATRDDPARRFTDSFTGKMKDGMLPKERREGGRGE